LNKVFLPFVMEFLVEFSNYWQMKVHMCLAQLGKWEDLILITMISALTILNIGIIEVVVWEGY